MLLHLLFVTSQCFVVHKQQLKDQHFKVHQHEVVQVLSYPAIDMSLTTDATMPMCSLRERDIQFETQHFEIIQDHDFKDYDFESDTPFNFRQFTSMAAIPDGLLTITSDLVIYLLKFNYDRQGSLMHKGKAFAGVKWRADFQPVVNVEAKGQLPQLIYCAKDKVAILIFPNSAQLFSIAQMEINTSFIDVFSQQHWIQRPYRGLTKEVDGFIFSVVGDDGLDIYHLADSQLTFLKNLKPHHFGLEGIFDIKDFAIAYNSGKRVLYLLDANRLLIANLDLDSPLDARVHLILQIPIKGVGISVDTQNGVNVILAYKDDRRYVSQEYSVSIAKASFEMIWQDRSYSKIFDVEMTKEFSVVQGLHNHKIIFNNQHKELVDKRQVTHFAHAGLRDFEYFEYNGDEYFFGITATAAFLTKLKIIDAGIVCYGIKGVQSYVVTFNSTVSSDESIIEQIIIQSSQQFTVEVVSTYVYEDSIFIIGLISTIAFVASCATSAVIFRRHIRLTQEQYALENELRKYTTNNTKANESIIKGANQSMAQMIQEQPKNMTGVMILQDLNK